MAERPFKWNKLRVRAANMVAEGKETHESVCKACKISSATLVEWKRRAEFKAKVAEITEAYLDSFLTIGIADRRDRLQRLSDTRNGLLEVIRQRAAETRSRQTLNQELRNRISADNPDLQIEMVDDITYIAPGMDTGLVVRTETPVKNGVKVEYVVDTATLAELRAIEAQAAKELGQWADRTELSTKDDKPLLILRGVSMDDI